MNHARPMAEARRAHRIRYAASVVAHAVALAAVLLVILAAITFSGPAPY